MANKRTKHFTRIKKSLVKLVKKNQRQGHYTSIIMLMGGRSYVLYIFDPKSRGDLHKVAIKDLTQRLGTIDAQFLFLTSAEYPRNIDAHESIVPSFLPQMILRTYLDMTRGTGKGYLVSELIKRMRDGFKVNPDTSTFLKAFEILERSGVLVIKLYYVWDRAKLQEVAREAGYSGIETFTVKQILRGK